jgi:hypothetical protein
MLLWCNVNSQMRCRKGTLTIVGRQRRQQISGVGVGVATEWHRLSTEEGTEAD